MKKGCFFLLLWVAGFFPVQAQLCINEILIANASVNYDREFFNFSSWIEIYNKDASPVNMSSYYLTDSRKKVLKWKFPNVTIPAKGFLLVWADKEDTLLHTNFKLDVNGEFIGLYYFNGQPVDTFAYQPQHPNISYGRSPDGSATWAYYGKPTPGRSNGTGVSTFTPNPVFSPRGGFYSSQVTVSLSCPSPTATLYYTLDGSEPADTSTPYTGPLVFNKNTVLRVRAYDNGKLPSDIITHSYFINETATVPVVSATVPPKFLWDDSIGIYVVGVNGVPNSSTTPPANYYRDWERAANVEFFPSVNDTAVINTYCGVEIAGSASRAHPQKSLDTKIKEKYGRSKVKYKLFPHRSYDNIHSFVIRNSGNDWMDNNNSAGIMCRDGLIQTVAQNQMDVDLMDYRPAIVFLNGQYWGITDFREKLDKYYCNNNFPQVDKDNLDMIKQFWPPGHEYEIVEGDTALMRRFFTFIKTNDMANASNYKKVCDSMDIREFINYIIVESFSNNIDWPVNNIKLWRQQGVTKWRWMVYDTDMGFGGFFPNAPPAWYPNQTNILQRAYAADSDMKPDNNYQGKWTSIVLGSLMKNTSFKNEFAQTYAAHLNSTYLPVRLNRITDSIKALLDPEIQRHINRWGSAGSVQSMANWQKNWNETYDFITERYPLVWTQLKNICGMNNMAPVKFIRQQANMGMIYVQGARMYDSIMKGSFFNHLPLELKAVPNAGYVFNWWEKRQNGSSVYFRNSLLTDVIHSNGTMDTIVYIARFSTTPLVDSFILTVNGGLGSGLYPINAMVPVAAMPSPANHDKYFVRWLGDVAGLANANDSATTLIMPAKDVVLTAGFAHELTVVNGTGSGIYGPLAEVPVNAAPAPPGKVFLCWTGDTAGLKNVFDSSTIYVMPNAKASLTATYGSAGMLSAANAIKITIFPNPASTNLNVIFDGEEKGDLYLMDGIGRVLQSWKVNGNAMQLSVNGLEQGMYFLMVKTEKGTGICKWLKR